VTLAPAGGPAGEGRVAVVTGAGRGLGAATALALAGQGWRLLLLDRCANDPGVPYPLASAADLERVAAACRTAAGEAGRVVARVGDVRAQDDLDAAVAAAVEGFGGLDAAVAAAGVLAGGTPAWATSEQVWDLLLDVDLTGVWRLARAAVPALLARSAPREGRFVAVSSAAGLGGLPLLAAYSAAKHGVLGLVRSLAADLAGTGVTANAVCPGSMDTPMLAATADLYGLAGPQAFAGHHLLGRLLDPAEVAAAIAWLCSPAGSGLTGAAVPVDAGMTAVSAWSPGPGPDS
jgi:SDR family mycofactocin-dependent oxidoreductase